MRIKVLACLWNDIDLDQNSIEFKDLLTAEVETGSTLILKYTINTESFMTWRYKLDNSSISFGIKRKKASQNLTSRLTIVKILDRFP